MYKMQPPISADNFVARDYQITIMEIAIQRNTIIFLPTGTGKTLIAVMILKRLSKPLQKSLSQGGKISIMIVNTVALVDQQSKYLRSLTDQDVGAYSGEMNVDFWSDDIWKEQFEKNQILVMTAQILVNILQKSILSLKDVNLLIFDECHNGVEDHPMTQIMSFYRDSEEYPRVVGLSATLLNKNCKAAQVLKEVEVLETTFHSKVATVEDLECLIGYATNPQEEIRVYRPYELIETDSYAINHLKSLKDILKNIQTNEKPSPPRPNLKPLNCDSDFKDMMNLLEDTIYHIENFGIYVGEIAVVAHTIQLERIKKNCQDIKVATVIDAAMTAFTVIKKIFNDKMKLSNKLERIHKYSSPQVIELFNIIRKYNTETKIPLCGIVFVQRRFTAKIIYNVLKNLKEYDPSFSFIDPNFIVGFNTNPFNDTRECVYNVKMNKKVFNEFRMKNINLLVASNVLEEGIDIPTCSLIVNFNEVTNYRAYIQAKGRARYSDSFYYMLVNSNSADKFHSRYNTFKKVEQILNCHLVGKNEDRYISEKDNEDQYNQNEILPYYANGPGSAQVDLLTAIPLVCVYCQCLPSDKYTIYTPNWFLNQYGDSQKYQVTIELPTVSGILDPIEGQFMQSKKLAKRAAALKTCIILHKKGELDDMLRPKQHASVDNDLSHYFLHWPKEKEINAGNTRQQRVYSKKIPDICKGLIEPNKIVYLHIIELTPSFTRKDTLGVNTVCDLYQSSLCYGIVSAQLLPKICQFTIYVTGAEILVNLNVNYKPITLSSENIWYLKSFHCVVFNEVLRILKPFLVFDNEIDKNGLLIAPLRKYSGHYEIDFEIAMQHMEIIDQKSTPTEQERLSLNVTKEGYNCKIVTPWYRPDDQQYLVIEVCEEKNVLSKFPSDEFSSYASYFNEKYRKTILNLEQPLLLVKPLSKKLNCIKPRSKGNKRNKEKQYEDMQEHLIPELCIKQEFPAELWLQASLLPTILNRIICLLQADELRILIGNESGLGVRKLSQLEEWTPLISDKHVIELNMEEASKSKKQEALPEEIIEDVPESPNKQLERDFSLKRLNAEYPWSEQEEPIDIERHLDITLMDVQYFVNFISQTKDSSDYLYKRDEVTNRSNLPAIKFDKEYSYKEIVCLKPSKNTKGPELIDIFTALATAKNNDIVNLERLETLGDSFLKVSISLFLILRYPKFDEGRLTNFKGRLISNKNLFYIGEKKGIPGYLKVSDFDPTFEWKPPSFCVPSILRTRINQSISLNSLFRFIFSKEEQVSGILSGESEQRIIDENEEIKENMEEVAYDSMHSFLDRQIVKDKTIADCIEALLGVYFQSYGFRGGLSFLKWLGIIPPSEDIENLLNMVPPNPVINANAAINNINFHIPTWKKVEEKLGYKFKDNGYLLQALTHSSYTPNRTTNCYQTLEFLGDAVLDFLITCHIYETCEDLTPGDLTDLRSALVNNVTFACFTVRCGFYKHLQYSNTQLLKYIDNFVQHQEENNHAINEEVLTLMDENDLHLAEHIDVPKVLGDVFEALIGAVFLDSGMCLETTWKIVHRIMWQEIELFKINVPKNPVRLIHETVGVHPEFRPPMNLDNGRTLVKLEFMLNGEKKTVHGFGENKVLAKKAAAKIALRLLQK